MEAEAEAEAEKQKLKLKPLASTRGHGAQRVRSTVTLDLVGGEKGELSQRDYTNPSSTGSAAATLTASRTVIISRYLVCTDLR